MASVQNSKNAKAANVPKAPKAPNAPVDRKAAKAPAPLTSAKSAKPATAVKAAVKSAKAAAVKAVKPAKAAATPGKPAGSAAVGKPQKPAAKLAQAAATRAAARGARKTAAPEAPQSKARQAGGQDRQQAQQQARQQSNQQAHQQAHQQTPGGSGFENMAQDWMAALQSMQSMWNPEPANAAAGPVGNVAALLQRAIPDLHTMPRAQIDPAILLELQQQYQRELGALWQGFLNGQGVQPQDRRFAGPDWQGTHAWVAALYELNSRTMTRLAEHIEGDAKTKARIRFAVSQWIDATAPTNFFATNPEAQKKLIESRGESLQAGLKNMLADLQKGRISMTDENAFEIGRNLATTEGAVVFQNDIFQLIQYKPVTATVYQRPLLLVPPSINKYYILDLQPDNSFVRHALSEGHNVFMVSWRNPDMDQAHLTWDDVIGEGVIRAIETVRSITGLPRINALGFCVGGTMLATALAVMAARGEDPVTSVTYLTTLLDFTDTGVLDIFIDENQVRQREQTIGGLTLQGTPGGQVGLMTARELGTSFSFLRPNDLVWNYVVNNYLKGETPPPFDLLYWNADSTNLPGPFFGWYLRNTYLENKLKQPNATVTCGQPVDFSRITAPTFIYGSREDHIVPWRSAYASTQLFNGPRRFVLGASGHIAGVINPPARRKRSYWTNDPINGRFPADAEAWFAGATEHPGSWWPEWSRWLASHSGPLVKAPTRAGALGYPVLEPAPGSYVRMRA